MCSTHCVPTSESFQWYGREIRRVTEIDYLRPTLIPSQARAKRRLLGLWELRMS